MEGPLYLSSTGLSQPKPQQGTHKTRSKGRTKWLPRGPLPHTLPPALGVCTRCFHFICTFSPALSHALSLSPLSLLRSLSLSLSLPPSLSCALSLLRSLSLSLSLRVCVCVCETWRVCVFVCVY